MLIEKANGEVYSQCRIPGIVITESGTLLAYYECRESNSDWAKIDVKIIRSADGGATFETVTVIEGKGNTLNNPVMFVNGDTLHFLFLKNYKDLFHCVSKDDGKTFSAPRQLTLESDFFYNAVAVGPGHGIVHNGKMIVPVWFALNKEDPYAHRPSVIATLYSSDGESWHIGEFIEGDGLINPSECALAITSDNRVLISIRNENERHQRAFALSDSGIDNWGAVYFNPCISDPVCMGSMCNDSEKIYHINCDSDSVREKLTVKISDDCFDSFKSVFVDTPAGYSDIAARGDTLYILYERDCKNDGLYFKAIKNP